MITFITGKPGGGKGLLAMKNIIDELVNTTSHVITNLAVKLLPWINGRGHAMIGLQQYLLQTYGKDFDVLNRVWILDDDQAAEFFLWRVLPTVEGGWKLTRAQPVMAGKPGNERVMEFDTSLFAKSGRCLYVIDEAWKFWGSRNWQRTGEGVLFYNAQHRKFGDDVLICTQHTKQIDPAVQRVAQDFWVVRNHSKLSIGMFRQPDVFSVAVYEHPPTGQTQEPMSRKLFTLDKKGIAQTYDTSAGVGLSGRMAADIGSRRKGLPWWVLIVAAISMLVLVSQTPHLLGRFTAWMMHEKKKPVAVAANKLSHYADAKSPQTNSVPSIQNNVAETNSVDLKPPVTCVGFCVLQRQNAKVFLSDGRIAEFRYGEVQRITRQYVEVFGQIFTNALPPQIVSPPVEFNSSVQSDAFGKSDDYQPSPDNVQVTYIGHNYRSPVPASGFHAPNYQSSFASSALSASSSGEVVQGSYTPPR